MSNILEVDPSLLKSSLLFVKDAPEEEMLKDAIKDVLDGKDPITENLTYRVVQPDPGVCVKIFTLENNKKVFINICQTDGIPAPETITHDELEMLLRTEKESSYRVPMSISELRQVLFREVRSTVCDVAIHPTFFKTVQTDPLFSSFLIQIIIEAMDQKYNVQLDGSRYAILVNKKIMGQLVRHRVQNRDVKKVYESYASQDEGTRRKIAEMDGSGPNKKRMVEELEPAKRSASQQKIPSWRLIKMADGLVIGEFYLPKCTDRDILLNVNEDRIVLHVPKNKFYLDGFLEHYVDAERCTSQFLYDKSILLVKMPPLA